MKIGLIGGTGDFGKGLALRLANFYEIFIGSRYENKAREAKEEYENILKKHNIKPKLFSGENGYVAKISDVVFLCIPYKYAFETVMNLKEYLKGKIIVSPIVPMKKSGDIFVYERFNGKSFAEKLQEVLNESKIVAALHTISAEDLIHIEKTLEGDVFICGEDDKSKKIVSEIISRIKDLKVYDIGGISMSIALESITVALINISKRYGIKNPFIKIGTSST